MSFAQWLERLMGMDERAWARHANPWSGWTRLAILPALALSVWSRVWLGWWMLVPLALVLIWTWVNPRLFPPPARLDNWMSQGVLGERIWLARAQATIPAHHARATAVLNACAVLGLGVLALGLWRLEVGLTLAGLVLSMGAKLWFLDRMVWLKAEMERPRSDP